MSEQNKYTDGRGSDSARLVQHRGRSAVAAAAGLASRHRPADRAGRSRATLSDGAHRAGSEPERHVEIPAPVRDVYRMWRPTPLHRARRLEKALGTTARIFYKYEGVSPAGSHKPNTAVAQAFYNQQEGVTKLSTETGAGQWGSALAFAGALFGLEVKVYMVKVSYNQKPYRRALMETYGARCVPSPSNETESGRAILAAASGFARQPRHRDLGGGRGRRQEPRHQICARQRAQPRAHASDRDRHRGDRADGAGRRLSRRGDRLRRRRLQFRRHRLPLHRQEAARQDATCG